MFHPASRDDMAPEVIDFLLRRKSVPIDSLREPGPTEEQIDLLIRIASRVPDHGRLVPWRFILYRGAARLTAGEMLAELAEAREGPLPPQRIEQERRRFSRAPLVVGVIHVPRKSPTIPQWEMMLSGAAAAMNLSIAATAMGFGVNWVTNWYADLPEGRAILGLQPEERVIGFVHIGTFDNEPPERPRPDPRQLVSDYGGPERA
jgi:nitroreductase